MDSAETSIGDWATSFIYILLPEPLMPLDRGARYEDALDAELRLTGTGHVSGGGSSLGEELADGSREIEFCGIDVDAVNLDRALELLRLHLPELGCLSNTQLHYRKGGEPLQDEYDGEQWNLGRPRTMMHPGFGV